MSEWLGVVSGVLGFVAALVPLFAGIKSRNPARRSYWEREVQARFGPDKEWPSDDRLRKRAELALAYVDADEAIRRTGVAGSATSWVLGGLSYVFVLFCLFQAQEAADGGDDEASGRWVLAAVVVLLVGAGAFADAASTPLRRQRLQRVLVEVIALPGGAEAVVATPESLVTAWMNRKTRKKLTRNAKRVPDPSRLYAEWAEALFEHHNNAGTKTLARAESEEE